MRDRDDGTRIAEENAAYRRGVVLGLTMAEVGILIIFVLLLLIGFNEWTKIKEREAAKDNVSVAKDRMVALEDAERQFSAVAAALHLPPTATEEEIRLWCVRWLTAPQRQLVDPRCRTCEPHST